VSIKLLATATSSTAIPAQGHTYPPQHHH